jgi:chemotaxis receptor (MCP) glutamine deamidase CheD
MFQITITNPELLIALGSCVAAIIWATRRRS